MYKLIADDASNDKEDKMRKNKKNLHSSKSEIAHNPYEKTARKNKDYASLRYYYVDLPEQGRTFAMIPSGYDNSLVLAARSIAVEDNGSRKSLENLQSQLESDCSYTNHVYTEDYFFNVQWNNFGDKDDIKHEEVQNHGVEEK
uniref:Uncharacterized protein n=1 Tax=Ditylenchus dipsaci TaxID=166011 RepID=A0A915ECE5_9BILA